MKLPTLNNIFKKIEIFVLKAIYFDPRKSVFLVFALQFWIWTSKIIPDLWLSAVFCPINKKITPPSCTGLPEVVF